MKKDQYGYPKLFWTQTEKVSRQPYFLGVEFRHVATIDKSTKHVRQIRIGLIWWHTGITFVF